MRQLAPSGDEALLAGSIPSIKSSELLAHFVNLNAAVMMISFKAVLSACLSSCQTVV